MRTSRGFTLLEVLAAVAFVGLVFTALSRSATVGIISEGDNRRRMEAAALADAEMTQIELGLQSSGVPEDGLSEREVDDFLIVTEVAPWTPSLELTTAIEEISPEGIQFFGGGQPDRVSPVREIRVRVEWFDGVDDRFIERVTLAVGMAPPTSGLPGGLAAPGR
ncbi:MAG: type II secretion system protein [Planctomycetes bacterium]|nr:type II secretion system protein [Planctomycetota bacterium]